MQPHQILIECVARLYVSLAYKTRYVARNQSDAVVASRSSVVNRSPNPNPFVLLHDYTHPP